MNDTKQPNTTKTGRIYQLVNMVTNEIYVGSTFQSIHKRHSNRKRLYRFWLAGKNDKSDNHKLFSNIYEYGWECFRIELLEEVQVNSKAELYRIEGNWIRKLDTFNNGLNGMIAGRTRKEYCEKNKDKIMTYRKKWNEKRRQQRADNREEYLEKTRKYYQENKSEIARKQKEKIKNRTEEEKQKAKEYHKKYREKNKEKLKEQRNKNYLSNREKIVKRAKLWRQNNKEKIKAYKKKYKEKKMKEQRQS